MVLRASITEGATMAEEIDIDSGWLQDVSNGEAGIQINGQIYSLMRDELSWIVERYDDQGKVVRYRVAFAFQACNCPDRIYRPDRKGGCKHMAGLRKIFRDDETRREQFS